MAAPPPAISKKPPVVPTAGPVKRPVEAAAKVKTQELTPPTPPTKPSTRAVDQQAAQPHLAVSGIVFQSDRQARLAVVNDLPVMEGTIIEGARIEEILADRVRFTWEGSTVEVGLGESN
jgi:general secretion pathway protein B